MTETALNPPNARNVGDGSVRPIVSAGQRAIARYPHWISDDWLAASLMAGIVATHVATIFGSWFYAFGLPQLAWNAANGTSTRRMVHRAFRCFLAGGLPCSRQTRAASVADDRGLRLVRRTDRVEEQPPS